jgi:four helix bundle suffix protein
MKSDSSILAHPGNYRKLLVYKKAEAIYDLTFWFCGKWLPHGDRTVDQMVQAARSGKQNIAEGSAASATSSETELKLLNVAKASFQELLADYEDFLRVRGHRQWAEDSPELEAMRRLGRDSNDGGGFVRLAESRPPETAANMAIVLLKQEDFLLARLLGALGESFKAHGGFRERLHAVRAEARGDAWRAAVRSRLSAASTPQELAARLTEMRAELSRAAAGIAREKGWEL